VIDSVEKLFEIEINHDVIALGNVLLRVGHCLVGGTSRSEAVAVLGKRWVPLSLENLQQGLLNQSVDDTRHSHVELHSSPANLWVPLKSRIHSIHYEANASSF